MPKVAPPPQLSPPVAPRGIPGNWKLVFSDDFNGVTLNLANWTANWLGAPGAITPPINRAELAAYDPAQVIVKGGLAHLTLVAQPATIKEHTYRYRSGIIQTHGKYHVTHGAFEARICLPSSNGKIANWPAWWTNGEHFPSSGENDIMEGLSGRVKWVYHSGNTHESGAPMLGGSGCHTYGSLWQKGRINYYFDGKHIGMVSSGVTSQPHYLVLNYAAGPLGGPFVAPATMSVDYVRVWQSDSE